MTVISIKELLGAKLQFAAGATLGQEHFPIILDQVRRAHSGSQDSVVVFDYAEVPDVSASYVKSTLLATHQCGRLAAGALSAAEAMAARATIVPLEIVVLAIGANEDVRDCINDVFAANGLAVLSGEAATSGKLECGQVLGVIETKALRTLQLCAQFEVVTAALLHSTQAAEGIAITGWNNRLADLHRQLLLRRQTVGRQHSYSSLVKGDIYYGKILSRK